MLPDDTLSTHNDPVDFILPYRENRLVDYEWGGIALNDSSQGLLHVIWKIWYDVPSQEIRIGRTDSQSYTVFLTVADVLSVGLAFDGNMNPAITYVVGNDSYLYYYDVVTNSFETISFDSWSNPCISLDDARPESVTIMDIILAYNKGSQLCYRQQRERYQVERVLAEDSPGNLWQIGMGQNNRFQFGFRICG